MRKLSIVFCMVLGIVLFSSTAWCDFYVVAAGKRAKQTILVSPKNTAGTSGAAMLNALNSITDASAANPYLILIEPGKYDIGSSSLQMKPYVSIQGSGESNTVITGDKGSANPDAGLLEGSDNAELSYLTVQNYCNQGNHVIAIYNNNCSPVMDHVSAEASAYSGNNCYGVYNDWASPVMTNMRIKASTASSRNEAVHNESSSPSMMNISAGATGGSYCRGVYNHQPGTVRMINVIATAANGIENTGILTESCSSIMVNVRAEAAGGTKSYGISFISAGNNFPEEDIVNSNAKGSGASLENIGIRVTTSSLIFKGVTASGWGAVGNGRGISNHNASSLRIDHSRVFGGQYSIFTTDEATYTHVGNTWLKGPVSPTGTCKCAGVYDDVYTFYQSTCP